MAEKTPRRAWRQAKGQCFEALALQFLEARGLELLARNVRCRLGEIDLVLLHHGTVVFTEVRYRRSTRYGRAHSTVDQQKQRRIRDAARFFLSRHPLLARQPCRFDVVGMEGSESGDITWIRGAFY